MDRFATVTEPNSLTAILERVERDVVDSNEVTALVYEELRKLARGRLRNEARGATLNTTVLVHEAYIRLGGSDELRWESRRHFFGAAANAMRQFLVDRARSKRAGKRDHKRSSADPDSVDAENLRFGDQSVEVLALHEALDRLDCEDARLARVVSLRFFGGLSVDETARVMGQSPATVKRDWSFARAWLFREMSE